MNIYLTRAYILNISKNRESYKLQLFKHLAQTAQNILNAGNITDEIILNTLGNAIKLAVKNAIYSNDRAGLSEFKQWIKTKKGYENGKYMVYLTWDKNNKNNLIF